jgi:hypothetical protein
MLADAETASKAGPGPDWAGVSDTEWSGCPNRRKTGSVGAYVLLVVCVQGRHHLSTPNAGVTLPGAGSEVRVFEWATQTGTVLIPRYD